MYFCTPMLGAYTFIIFMSSWWVLPLSIMKCASGCFIMALVLNSVFSDMSIVTQFFFPCPFAWNIFFQFFTFSLCRSFVLRWVSCRQHMCGSCFLTHSATPCLLIGAFNPLTFEVITDRYLLIFPLCACVTLSHYSFLFLACLVVLVWCRCIVSAFFFLGHSLHFSLPF